MTLNEICDEVNKREETRAEFLCETLNITVGGYHFRVVGQDQISKDPNCTFYVPNPDAVKGTCKKSNLKCSYTKLCKKDSS